MKRIRPLALLLALIMLFSVGCTPNGTEDPATTPDGDEETTVTTPTTGTEDETQPTTGISIADAPADVPADRYDATVTPRTGNNATSPLVLQTSELAGVFNSMFYTDNYEADVIGNVALGLLYYDKDTIPKAGIEYPCLAYDFETVVADDNSSSSYKLWLKNGITFSDGTPVTVKDVLFTCYVLSDPKYDGIISFYNIPIAGMKAYRMQINEDLVAVTDAIIEAGLDTAEDGSMMIPAAEGATTAEQEAFWADIDQAGIDMAQEIIDTVNTYYLTDEYVDERFAKGMTAAQIDSDELKTAFGMSMWGFGGGYDVASGVFTDAADNTYTIGTDTLNAETFWNVMLQLIGYDVANLDAEAAEVTLSEKLRERYVAAQGASASVDSIRGITYGTEFCADGIEREYIQFDINGVDPTTIFKIGNLIESMNYMNEGYTGTLNEFGVDFDNPEYIAHLKTKSSAPMGAGPYIFEKFEDNVVYFEANDNFLLGSPKIKYLRMQVIGQGAEMDAVKTETVHFANPSASTDIITEISSGEAENAMLGYTLVDNDGYGYLGINGRFFPEWDVRKAIAHALNLELCLEYYGEIATINYRPMTKVQWAYPENPQNLFPYDDSGETSKSLLLSAGYIYDEAANIMYYPEGHEKAGQQFTFKASIPGEASDHPAGGVLLNLQKVMAKIGVKVDIDVDINLLGKLSTAFESGVQIWVAAWGSGGADPDMFQIWYSDPNENTGPSPGAKGLYYLFTEGSADQKDALVRLNSLITAGRTTLDVEQRKVIYAQALELAASLATEIPTYQRKNMFVYNTEIINVSTMFGGEDVTPFQSPIAYIWNVELN